MAHEHRDLVTALAAGDGDAARKVCVAQILESQRMVIDALLSSPAVLATRVGVPAPRPAKVRRRPAAKLSPRRRR